MTNLSNIEKIVMKQQQDELDLAKGMRKGKQKSMQFEMQED